MYKVKTPEPTFIQRSFYFLDVRFIISLYAKKHMKLKFCDIIKHSID